MSGVIELVRFAVPGRRPDTRPRRRGAVVGSRAWSRRKVPSGLYSGRFGRRAGVIAAGAVGRRRATVSVGMSLSVRSLWVVRKMFAVRVDGHSPIARVACEHQTVTFSGVDGETAYPGYGGHGRDREACGFQGDLEAQA